MNKKTPISAAIAVALALALSAPAFAGGSTPQATSGDGYVSACGAAGSSTGCAPNPQPDSAQATGYGSTAVGIYANASGRGALAVGSASGATGQYATMVGTGGIAAGDGSTAIGNASAALGNNSVALGAGSFAYRNDVVSVGNSATGMLRIISNVGAGQLPTDAANVGQVDAALIQANAYTNIVGGQVLQSANAYTDQLTAALSDRIDGLDTRLSTSMAMSAASATLGNQCNFEAQHCLGVAVGFSGGMGAVAFGYRQRAGYGSITATASLAQHDAEVGIGWGASW